MELGVAGAFTLNVNVSPESPVLSDASVPPPYETEKEKSELSIPFSFTK
jgi:hypothetical protein